MLSVFILKVGVGLMSQASISLVICSVANQLGIVLRIPASKEIMLGNSTYN